MIKSASWLKLLSLLLVLSVFVACDDDDDDGMEGPMTITATAQADRDLSILVQALVKADLATTLEGDGPFTVFAPSDAAFTAFLSANGFASLDDVPNDVLTNVLLNHVVSGTARSTDLSSGYITTLATAAAAPSQNVMAYVSTDGGVTINGASSVTTADIEASNGVIHKVDAVIGLASVTTLAASNPDFSNLVAALTRSDLSANYATVLDDATATYTVFAPNDAAFGAVLDELGLTALGDIPAATLEAVLLYHVVGGANVRAADVTDGLVVTPLNGVTFTMNTAGGVTITDSAGRVTNVVATDVQGNNGVIHVIDRVLLPL